MFGDINWNDLLARKYDILGQHAQAAMTGAQGQLASGTGLGAYYGAQALQAPGLAAAEEAQRYGQAGLAGAQEGQTRLTTKLMPESSGFTSEQALQTRGLGGGQAPASGANPYLQKYKSGTSKVPGKGSGKVDKVPAELAPGEAVLNKAAAEHLGRDTIALLNAIGAHKMGLSSGMDDQGADQSSQAPQQAQGTTQGYAKGTNKVPAKAPAKAAPKGKAKAPEPAGGLSPELMQAILQMGQGGGGMPSPGSAQPMPMQMPMMGGPPPGMR